MKTARVPLVVLVSLGFMACSSRFRSSPQIIVADGESYIACHDLIWMSDEGGSETTFKVTFTDAEGLEHLLKGIKKLSMSDMPKLIPAPMPSSLPDAKTGIDLSGKPYTEGVTYTWADGTQAVLKKGVWNPVMRVNGACSPD